MRHTEYVVYGMSVVLRTLAGELKKALWQESEEGSLVSESKRVLMRDTEGSCRGRRGFWDESQT